MNDGRLFGWSGDFADAISIRAWLDGGDKPDLKARVGSGLIIEHGTVYRIEEHLQKFKMPRFTAAGTGRDYAIAAMHLGQNAHTAITIASIYDPCTGMGIDTLCESVKE